ncbi:MAG: hypothetical protein NTX25_09195 [Proteobacteria bacterium]|nr:hypothetical protein [Pseudomonadota bacterium]
MIKKVLGWRLLFCMSFVLINACKTLHSRSSDVQSAGSTDPKVSGLGVENPPPDEAGYIKQLQDLTIVVMQANRQRAGTPDAPLPRDVHSKTHGCIKGVFEIDPNLDKDLRTGVFQAGARYPVIIRTSPGVPGVNPDSTISSRGFAMKLLQVNAVLDKYPVPENERAWLLPQFAGLQQDFTFLNGESFIMKDLSSYIKFTEALNNQNPFPAFINPNPLHPVFKPGELTIFMKEVLQKVDNPLSISYFGELPYKFKDTAYKFRIDHCPSQKPLPKSAFSKDDPDFLRKAMTETLKSTTVCYSFSIILQQDPRIQPIEDSTVVWPSSDSDIAAHKPTANRTEIGRITIPPQDFSSKAAEQRCESLSFNPWNGLTAHKPLGNMNRARKAVYLTGAGARPSDRGDQVPDAEQLEILKKNSAYGKASQ